MESYLSNILVNATPRGRRIIRDPSASQSVLTSLNNAHTTLNNQIASALEQEEGGIESKYLSSI